MYFGSSAGVKKFQDEGIDTTFLPFFSQNGEKWIMTTPYFQVALNRDLEQDTARRSNAMKVLNVMLSEEAQNRIVADGQDVLSYSQNVPLRLTDYMKDVRSVVEENHMYAVLKLLDNSAFQGNASNYVIYPDGRVVIDNSVNRKETVYNFIAMLREHSDLSEKQILALSDAFAQGSSGNMRVTLGGTSYYLVYEGTAVQSWTMLGLVPVRIVNASLDKLCEWIGKNL